MSLFRPLRMERRDLSSSSSIPTNWEGWNNASGQHVTTDRALRLAAVYGSVDLIASALATTPIDTYRKRTDSTPEELPSPSLLDTPSGSMEPVEWKSALFASALLTGNAFGVKDNFDIDGYPREIHLVHPDDASVTRRSREDPTPIYRFGGEEIARRRVFHLKGFCLPGDLVGLSPVRYFAQTIGMGLAAEGYGASFYDTGGHPTAILETEHEVTEPAAKAVKARVLDALRGRREPLVLGKGLTWKPIQIPPNEALFLESLKMSGVQIANMIFHVPASMLGLALEGSNLTYSNREQDEILFQTRACLPWAVRFEQHISRQLPRPRYVRLNFDASVRVDLTTRYKAHAIGIAAGFWTDDEAREKEDLPPLTDAQREQIAKSRPVQPPTADTKEDER